MDIAISILGDVFFSRLECNGPVHQIEIEIIQLKILKGNLKCLFNVFRAMTVVPKLGSNKEFFTRNFAILDGLSNFLFVAI